MISPSILARTKSNPSLSVADLLPATGAETQSQECGVETTDDTSKPMPLMSHASERAFQQHPTSYKILHRARSLHLDPAVIRKGMRSPSDVQTLRTSSEIDILAFINSNRWNANRSITPTFGRSSVSRSLPARGEVYSPSIYSRTTSAEISNDLDAAVQSLNWPLALDEASEQNGNQVVTVETGVVAEVEPLSVNLILEQKSLPPLPDSPPSSTATLQPSSPLKQMIKKRRSLLRFLRPGSRRQQIRSISSPVLPTAQLWSTGIYDGPSDESMLTMPYELTDYARDRQSTAAISVPQERRPTLAEYERNLTASGDRRRRPSELNCGSNQLSRLQDLCESMEEESIEGVQGEQIKETREEHDLNNGEEMLMAQALRKHQQEKLMFRSESKRRESMADLPSTSPLCSVLPSTPSSSSLFLPNRQNAITLEQNFTNASQNYLGLTQEGRRRSSSLRPPNATGSLSNGTFWKSTTVSIATGPPGLEKSVSVPTRIGTTSPSWSRYPSHTRSLRCGSAGAESHDSGVIARDFVIGNSEIRHPQERISPASRISSWTVKPKSLIKSPSRTFSRVIQYYTDLFTRPDFRGGNRRTSVSTSSGGVVRPELEMLPSVTGAEARQEADNKHLRETEAVMDAAIDLERDADNTEANARPWKQGDIFAVVGSKEADEEEAASPFDGTGGLEVMLPRKSSAASKTSGESRVRHYPSVTVVDDCLGGTASIGFIGNAR